MSHFYTQKHTHTHTHTHTYIYIYTIWPRFDNTGFKFQHTVHIISGSAISSLKTPWCAPVIQRIHNVWYYHCHGNQWPDQQASCRQQCQTVHYDHCPRLLIFHTLLSSDRAPNAAALNAAQSLIQCGVTNGHIASNRRVAGHRDVGATACPGYTLYSIIRGWPNYNANPACSRQTSILFAEGIVKDGSWVTIAIWRGWVSECWEGSFKVFCTWRNNYTYANILINRKINF